MDERFEIFLDHEFRDVDESRIEMKVFSRNPSPPSAVTITVFDGAGNSSETVNPYVAKDRIVKK